MDRSALGSGLWRRFGMAAILFLSVAGFYWKLTLNRHFEWMRGPDLAEQVLTWFELQAREWHAWRFPLWDPYVWSGQPLLGQAQPGAAYPLNWLLFWLPMRDGHIAPLALAWYYVAIHLMAAAFCYWLCRDLGRSRTASLAGGLIFSLSGFLGNTDWPQMMNGAVWVPLVFLFQFRALRGTRVAASAALSGMFLGIAWLSGHHQIPTFTTLAWGAVWLWFAIRQRAFPAPAFQAVAVSLLFAGLTGAMQILPAWEYGRLARRWVSAPDPVTWKQAVPYSVHATYDLKAVSLFGVVFPSAKTHFDPFVGIVALALAGLGVAALWRDGRVRMLAALGMGAMVYALGHNSVFQGLLYATVPELDKARSPSTMVLLFQFATAALAAFGLDHLSSREYSPWTRRVMWTLAGFGVLTLGMAQAILLANKLTFPPDDRVILTGAIALLLAVLVYACRRETLTRMQANSLLVLLLLFELGNGAQYGLADRADRGQMQWLDQMRGNGDIAEFLRKQPGFQRAEVAQDAFAPNWGAWHRVEMFGGKGASVTVNVLDSELFSLTGHRMYGVAYTIAAGPVPNAGDEVFAGASGLKVYRRDAFPRAWAVHEVVRVPQIGAGNVLVWQDPEAFRHKAHIAGPAPAVEACSAPDRVALVEHDADRLLIRAEMGCAGMVVLSDTFYPGWRARVDHKPAAIYEVNGAMRGVVVPAGTHTVTMRYRPVSVYLGAAMTLAGILGSLGMAAAVRSRDRKEAISNGRVDHS
jgi:hypothetical protein